MSDTYRGYAIPEIIQVDQYYWIVDERFGEHKGYTPEVAVMFWKLRVDVELTEDAIEMGLIAREGDNGAITCLECGAAVDDVALHLYWHRKH